MSSGTQSPQSFQLFHQRMEFSCLCSNTGCYTSWQWVCILDWRRMIKKGYVPAALVLFSKFSQEPHPETSIYISLASILSHELPGCKGVQEAFKMKQVATMNRIRISILKKDRQDKLWVKDSAIIIIIILTVLDLHCSAQAISCIT